MKIFSVISLLLLSLLSLIAAPAEGPREVMATNSSGRLVTPTNFFYTNLIAGSNIFIQRLPQGRIAVHAATSVTNQDVAVAAGTNIVVATNVVGIQTVYTVSQASINDGVGFSTNGVIQPWNLSNTWMVAMGDSISAEGDVIPHYPNEMTNFIWWGGLRYFTNQAVGGDTIFNQTNRFYQNTLQHLPAQATDGTNVIIAIGPMWTSFAQGSATATQVINAYSNVAQTCLSRGYQLFVANGMWRADFLSEDNYTNAVYTVDWMLTRSNLFPNVMEFARPLADFTDTNYFAIDGIHPTQAGQFALARILDYSLRSKPQRPEPFTFFRAGSGWKLHNSTGKQVGTLSSNFVWSVRMGVGTVGQNPTLIDVTKNVGLYARGGINSDSPAIQIFAGDGQNNGVVKWGQTNAPSNGMLNADGSFTVTATNKVLSGNISYITGAAFEGQARFENIFGQNWWLDSSALNGGEFTISTNGTFFPLRIKPSGILETLYGLRSGANEDLNGDGYIVTLANNSLIDQNSGGIAITNNAPGVIFSMTNGTVLRLSLTNGDFVLDNLTTAGRIFKVATNSAYTGTGNFFLADDGVYHPGTGAGATNAVGIIQIDGVTITNQATSLNFITGTNVVLKGTNMGSGFVDVQINSVGAVSFSDLIFTNSNSTISNKVAGSNFVLRAYGAPSNAGLTNFDFRTTAGRVGNKTNAIATFWNGPTNAMSISPEGGIEMFTDSRVWQPGGLSKDQALLAFRDLSRDTNANPSVNVGVYNPGAGGNGTDFILSMSHQSILSQFDTYGGFTTNKAFFGIQAHRTAGQGGASDLRLWGFVRDTDRWQLQPTTTKASGDSPYYFDTAEYRNATYAAAHTDFRNFGTNVLRIGNDGSASFLYSGITNGDISVASDELKIKTPGLSLDAFTNGGFIIQQRNPATNQYILKVADKLGNTMASVVTNSGYGGGGTKFLSDNGTYQTVGGTGSETNWTRANGALTPTIYSDFVIVSNLFISGAVPELILTNNAGDKYTISASDILQIQSMGGTLNLGSNGTVYIKPRNAMTTNILLGAVDAANNWIWNVSSNGTINYYFAGLSVADTSASVDELKIKTLGLSLDAFTNGLFLVQQRNAASNQFILVIADKAGNQLIQARTNGFIHHANATGGFAGLGMSAISNYVITNLTGAMNLKADQTLELWSLANSSGYLSLINGPDGTNNIVFLGTSFYPITSNTLQIGKQLRPFEEGHFQTLLLSGNTNRYTDNGTTLLRNGIPFTAGGGGAGWTNNGTILYPDVAAINDAIVITNNNSGIGIGNGGTGTAGEILYSSSLFQIGSAGNHDFELLSHGVAKWYIEQPGDFLPSYPGQYIGTNGNPVGTVVSEVFIAESSTLPGILELDGTNGVSQVRLTLNPDATTTNEIRFDLKSMAAGQLLTVHSQTVFGPTNLVVLTNLPPADQVVNNGISNFVYFSTNLTTVLVPTNSSQSNLTVNFDIPHTEYYITNNVTLTNHSGLVTGTAKDVRLHFMPQLINRGVGYPTLGAAGYSTYWHTNANSPLWTTLTNGIEYVLSLSTRGTNVYASISEWK